MCHVEVQRAHALMVSGDLECRNKKNKTSISVYLLHFEETTFLKGTLAEPCDVKTCDQMWHFGLFQWAFVQTWQHLTQRDTYFLGGNKHSYGVPKKIKLGDKTTLLLPLKQPVVNERDCSYSFFFVLFFFFFTFMQLLSNLNLPPQKCLK